MISLGFLLKGRITATQRKQVDDSEKNVDRLEIGGIKAASFSHREKSRIHQRPISVR